MHTLAHFPFYEEIQKNKNKLRLFAYVHIQKKSEKF